MRNKILTSIFAVGTLFALAACSKKESKTMPEDMSSYWNDEMVSTIENEVYANCKTPSLSEGIFDITSSKYSSLVDSDFVEEYFTHEDATFLSSLSGVGTLLRKDDNYSDYAAKPLIRKTQKIVYHGAAIQAAIDDATSNGGGIVKIPDNATIYTGALTLKDNVYLYIPQTSTLKFIRNKSNDYYPLVLTRFEGVELYNFSPFIYSYEAKNIGIFGGGTLDGQADLFNWMPWKYGFFGALGQDDRFNAGNKYKLFKMGDDNIPVDERVYDDSFSLLRPNFVQPYKSENILIEDIKIINSPMWEINPVLCKNVLTRNVNITSKLFNNDGFDPECSENCILENSVITTGDDCVALKAGRDGDGRRINKPCTNIILRNNVFADGHGGITLGSDTTGDITNVFAENITLDSKELEYAIRYKSSNQRGGKVENLYIRNININEVKNSVIHYDFAYDNETAGEYPPSISKVYLSNIKTSDKTRCSYAFYVKGLRYGSISEHYFKNCKIEVVGSNNHVSINYNTTGGNVDISTLDINLENSIIH